MFLLRVLYRKEKKLQKPGQAKQRTEYRYSIKREQENEGEKKPLGAWMLVL
jgi:hypothetical protein